MGRRFLSLLFILVSLTYFVSAVLFGKKTPPAVSAVAPRLDALGAVSDAIQCREKYFHKIVVYATIREACTLLRTGRQMRGECKKSWPKLLQSNACQLYPKEFHPTGELKFKSYTRRSRRLFSFPLLEHGRLFDETRSPGYERVIFDSDCNAAGATTSKTRRGYTEACVINHSPPKQGFFSTGH